MFARFPIKNVFSRAKLFQMRQIKPVKHVLVFKNHKLSLLEKDPESRTYQIAKYIDLSDKHYNTIKEVSHLPLLIQTLLLKSTPCLKKMELEELLKKIPMVRDEIDLAPKETIIQQQILDKSAHFISTLLESSFDENETEAKVNDFFKNIFPELAYNRKLAARIQLEKLDHAMIGLEKTFAWDLRDHKIVIVGPKGPRENLLEKQYFEKLFSPECISYMEKMPHDIADTNIADIPSYLYPDEVKAVSDKTSDLPVSQTSSSKTTLKKLNEAFLKEHSLKAKEMLVTIETVMIYYQGKISLWQMDKTSKDFERITDVTLDSDAHIDHLISNMQKEYKIDLTKNRMIIGGCLEKTKAFKNEAENFYATAGIKNAENNFIFCVESKPNDDNLKKHFIDSFLAGAELNKIYGEALVQDKRFMLKDVLGEFVPPILSTLFKEKRTSYQSDHEARKMTLKRYG